MGDLDYFAKALGLPRSTMQAGPCSLCRCKGSGPYSWMNFSVDAAWRSVIWTAHGWRNWPERSKSPLFSMEGFSPHLIALDWMHNKYLGHDQVTYASILVLLTHHVLRSSPASNTQTIWKQILEYYKSHHTPSRYRCLKLSMFLRKAPAYPKLRGKAAEIKWLAGPLLWLWEQHMNKNLYVHQQILVYLKLNLEVENILTDFKDSMAFPPDIADKFEHTVTTMLLVLSGIAEHFLADKLFSITQKAHFCQHISMMSRFLSPRLTWCFCGEDMQKRMSHLCKACVQGQKPSQSVLKLIARYRVGLHLQFMEHS